MNAMPFTWRVVVSAALLAAAGAITYFLWRITPSDYRPFNFILVFGVVAGLALTAVGPVGPRAWRLIASKFLWKQEGYDKIGGLFAGMSINKMQETLGSPLFVDASALFNRSIFRGRGFWVQAVHDPPGTVHLLSITSASPDFRPTFDTPVGRITLNESTFAAPSISPTQIHYNVGGSSGNTSFFDEYYLGNPGNYKTYFIGFARTGPGGPSFPYDPKYAMAEFDSNDATVAAFRNSSRVNTYAETSASATVDVIIKLFGIGVDWLKIRTAPSE